MSPPVNLAPARGGGAASLLADLRAIPNLLSLARVVLIYVALGLLYAGRPVIALGIGFIGGISDYLDGYLARRLGQSTRVGALIDQAADVLFIIGTIFFFVQNG